jgi:hypothetical protein
MYHYLYYPIFLSFVFNLLTLSTQVLDFSVVLACRSYLDVRYCTESQCVPNSLNTI